jgi:hypothetical protein
MWILGWIMYQPVAAIIYAAGFKLLASHQSTENGLLNIMYGLCLMFMAVLALPAVMRLVHPPTEPVASGSGAGATVAGAGMVVASAGMRR